MENSPDSTCQYGLHVVSDYGIELDHIVLQTSSKVEVEVYWTSIIFDDTEKAD
jgi:hypothetical protein